MDLKMDRTVLCYVEGAGREWQGVCLDFDIAIQGESFEQVRELLGEAITSYVEDVSREDAETQRQLFNRRTPLLTRLGFKWRFLSSALMSQRHSKDLRGSFELPCHA